MSRLVEKKNSNSSDTDDAFGYSDEEDSYASSYEYNSDESDTPYKYVSDDEEQTDGKDYGRKDDDVNNLKPTVFMQRMQSYDIVDNSKITNFVKNTIESIMDKCGVTHSTAAHILICYDWNEDLVSHLWWEGENDSQIQQSRDKVCLKAGMPKHGPLVHGKKIEKNCSICFGCKACPRELLKNQLATTQQNNNIKQTYKKKKKIKKSRGMKTGIKAIHQQLRKVKTHGGQYIDVSIPNVEDMSIIHVDIKCQGMWTGISCTFQITLPKPITNYPFHPPKSVICLEKNRMFHPNINPDDGTVCLSILNEDWSPMNTMNDICNGLQTLFIDPNWGHSLNPDCNTLYDNDIKQFKNKLQKLGAVIKKTAKKKGFISSFSLSSSKTKKQSKSSKTNGIDNNNISKKKEIVDEMDLSPTKLMRLQSTTTTLALSCGHYFCETCWKQYLNSKVLKNNSYSFIFTPCPMPKCNNYINEHIVESVTPEHLNLFKKGFLETYVQKTQKVKYCPRGCGKAVMYPSLRAENRCIVCKPGCGHMWCFGCEEAPHVPVSCETRNHWLNIEKTKFKGGTTDDIWMAQNVKPCPFCKRNINKDGGCMHMTCRRSEGGCGKEFCWLCLGPWSEHGEGTGGFYACTKYQEAKKRGTLSGAAKRAAIAKQYSDDYKELTKRYEFHVQRFKFAEQSAEHADALSENFKEWASTSLRNNRAMEQATALIEACECVRECRKVLQWVYTMKYYINKEASFLNLFESTHHEFEGMVDKLQSHLEEFTSFIDLGNGDIQIINVITQIATLVKACTNFYNELARPEEFKIKYFNFDESLNDELVGLEFFTGTVISPMDVWEAKNNVKLNAMKK